MSVHSEPCRQEALRILRRALLSGTSLKRLPARAALARIEACQPPVLNRGVPTSFMARIKMEYENREQS